VLQVLEALEASFAKGKASHGRGLGAALETGLAALELGQGGGQIITCLSGAADLGPGSGDGVCLFTLHILLFVLPPNLLPPPFSSFLFLFVCLCFPVLPYQ